MMFVDCFSSDGKTCAIFDRVDINVLLQIGQTGIGAIFQIGHVVQISRLDRSSFVFRFKQDRRSAA